MKLTHFYHVFADGDFRIPLEEHLAALAASGLADALDGFFLGVVGSADNRARVSDFTDAEVVAEAETGWEQVTLEAVRAFAASNDGAVFYAHSKGAWSRSELARQWRVSMTHDTVTRWRECVHALQWVQAAGPYWLKSREPEHAEHESFFAGNFWWARTDYLRLLPPLKTDNRYRAEGWIGLAHPSVRIMREGYSYWGNFWSNDEA